MFNFLGGCAQNVGREITLRNFTSAPFQTPHVPGSPLPLAGRMPWGWYLAKSREPFSAEKSHQNTNEASYTQFYYTQKRLSFSLEAETKTSHASHITRPSTVALARSSAVPANRSPRHRQAPATILACACRIVCRSTTEAISSGSGSCSLAYSVLTTSGIWNTNNAKKKEREKGRSTNGNGEQARKRVA